MSASQKPLGVLVVGSLPPPVGGTTVTLEFLVEALRQRADVAVSVVDTSGIRGGGLRGLVRLVRAMLDVWRRARAVEVVSLHVATPALPLWGLVVLTLARLARRPFVLRKFADLDYRSRGPVWGRLGHRVVCWSDVYLAETRRHLEEVKARGIRHAHWFPTARPEPGAPRVVVAGARCRRFVYVGLVCRLKGLVELVEAMELLPPEVTLDVYGPITGDLPAGLFERRPGVAYRGPLAPGAVVETMTRYDALVLPTLAKTEGYPGSVLEAYAAGLPVIVSRIGGIPEIVDGTAGILVEPGRPGELAQAMARICSDPSYFGALRESARTKAKEFSSARWAEKFVELCREAIAAAGA